MLATALAPFLARRGIHYGWIMAAVTFLTMLSTAAAMGMPGVLLAPLRSEFGWSLGAISAPMALRIGLYGLMGPFTAALLARYGIRAVVTVAMLLIVGGIVLAARMTALWELWLTWGLMVGLGSGMTALVVGASVANRWFAARRGLVVGLLTASSATGSLLFLPLAAWLSQHFGWRVALLPAAAACAVAGVLMLLFGRDHPAELGLPAFGEQVVTPLRPSTANPARMALATLAQVSGTRTFWLLFLTFFVCGLSTNGLIGTHFIPLCQDFGLAATTAAGMLAMMGAFDFVGTIGSGWLSDRVDSRKLLFMYYGLRGLSLMALPFTNFSIVGLSFFAVFYGLDWIATVPPTVRLASAAFGRERGSVVFGWVFCGHQLGAAFATFAGGISRDALASYLPAFFAAGAACMVAAAASIAIRRRPAEPPALLPGSAPA
jgi:sugar phosphate permease